MNICFWRFAFFSACAVAIFSWNVKVVAFLFLGRGTVVVVVFVASSSSVEADFGAAAAFVLSFLLFLVLKDFDVDIFVTNKIMESKEERGEYRGVVVVCGPAATSGPRETTTTKGKSVERRRRAREAGKSLEEFVERFFCT